jgi:hypothetical protein
MLFTCSLQYKLLQLIKLCRIKPITQTQSYFKQPAFGQFRLSKEKFSATSRTGNLLNRNPMPKGKKFLRALPSLMILSFFLRRFLLQNSDQLTAHHTAWSLLQPARLC